MGSEYTQIQWDAALAADCLRLVRTAIQEDLGREHDWTTTLLIPDDAQGRAAVVARQPGIVAGLPAGALLVKELDSALMWNPTVAEGSLVDVGTTVATLAGPARSMLVAERTLLNLLGRVSGVATLTRRYVDAVANAPGSKASVYDTRKTTAGWRRLEKYAVGQGGGHNHRTGLFDGVLIKDNHLAVLASVRPEERCTPAEAVRRAKAFLASAAMQRNDEKHGTASDAPPCGMPIEVEVDTLVQLEQVLPEGPDIVLLDNMSLEQLREAVRLRDARAPQVVLEASGGIRLDTIAAIASTGVDRISAGALTHSAIGLDFGLDWAL